MKLLLFLLLLTGSAYAQAPASMIRQLPAGRDSMPRVFPPDLIPNVAPANSFYRYKFDPPNVMRATLDNMPIKRPDSSGRYTMLRWYPRYQMPIPQPFTRPLIPQPQVSPK